MTIEFHCPDCHKLLRTTDEKAGLTTRCPACQCSLIVPDSMAATFPSMSGHQADKLASATATRHQQTSRPANVSCAVCGEELSAFDTVCSRCGEKQAGRVVPVRQYDQDTTLAIVSLVTGSLSVVLYCCINLLTFPLALTAVITGIISIRRTLEGRGMAIGGICCGAVSLLLTFAYIAFFVAMIVSEGM